MTGEQFVKLCYEEKKTILAEYFNPNSSSVVGKKISAITEQGISKDDLYDLLNLVLKENYYTLLLECEQGHNDCQHEKCRCSAFMGNLPKYSVCTDGINYHSFIL